MLKNNFINRGFRQSIPLNQTVTVVTQDIILFQGLGDNAKPLKINGDTVDKYIFTKPGMTLSLSSNMSATTISNTRGTLFSFVPNGVYTNIDSFDDCLLVQTVGAADTDDA